MLNSFVVKGQNNGFSALLKWPLAQLFPAFWFTRALGRKSSPSGDARTASIMPGSKSTVRGVDAAGLRVVVAVVLAVAADAVNVQNLARRNSLEAGSTRQRKGGEERRIVRKSAW